LLPNRFEVVVQQDLFLLEGHEGEQFFYVAYVFDVVLPSDELRVTQGVLPLHHQKLQHPSVYSIKDDPEGCDRKVAIL
jgi:hypothetical protein